MLSCSPTPFVGVNSIAFLTVVLGSGRRDAYGCVPVAICTLLLDTRERGGLDTRWMFREAFRGREGTDSRWSINEYNTDTLGRCDPLVNVPLGPSCSFTLLLSAQPANAHAAFPTLARTIFIYLLPTGYARPRALFANSIHSSSCEDIRRVVWVSFIPEICCVYGE